MFAKNAEECANSMQFYMEEFVEKDEETQKMARKAYLSFLRSYSSYSSEMKKIFHLNNLHIGHVAKSFGLREAPTQISSNRSNKFENFSKKSKNNDDPLKSKFARDLKRLNNNHREYGNVIKKNKLRSQKQSMDLRFFLFSFMRRISNFWKK